MFLIRGDDEKDKEYVHLSDYYRLTDPNNIGEKRRQFTEKARGLINSIKKIHDNRFKSLSVHPFPEEESIQILVLGEEALGRSQLVGVLLNELSRDSISADYSDVRMKAIWRFKYGENLRVTLKTEKEGVVGELNCGKSGKAESTQKRPESNEMHEIFEWIRTRNLDRAVEEIIIEIPHPGIFYFQVIDCPELCENAKSASMIPNANVILYQSRTNQNDFLEECDINKLLFLKDTFVCHEMSQRAQKMEEQDEVKDRSPKTSESTEEIELPEISFSFLDRIFIVANHVEEMSTDENEEEGESEEEKDNNSPNERIQDLRTIMKKKLEEKVFGFRRFPSANIFPMNFLANDSTSKQSKREMMKRILQSKESLFRRVVESTIEYSMSRILQFYDDIMGVKKIVVELPLELLTEKREELEEEMIIHLNRELFDNEQTKSSLKELICEDEIVDDLKDVGYRNRKEKGTRILEKKLTDQLMVRINEIFEQYVREFDEYCKKVIVEAIQSIIKTMKFSGTIITPFGALFLASAGVTLTSFSGIMGMLLIFGEGAQISTAVGGVYFIMSSLSFATLFGVLALGGLILAFPVYYGSKAVLGAMEKFDKKWREKVFEDLWKKCGKKRDEYFIGNARKTFREITSQRMERMKEILEGRKSEIFETSHLENDQIDLYVNQLLRAEASLLNLEAEFMYPEFTQISEEERVKNEIGEGSYSWVYKTRYNNNNNNNNMIAIKEMKGRVYLGDVGSSLRSRSCEIPYLREIHRMNWIRRKQREVWARKETNNNNNNNNNANGLLSLICCKISSDGNCKIGMKYFRGGTFKDIIRINNEEFPIKKKVDLFLQVVRSVAFLHDHGVIHRDIKPTNILLNQDRTQAILCDFTTTVDLMENIKNSESFVGSPGYAEVENIGSLTATTSGSLVRRSQESHIFGKGRDIFSLGVILAHVVTGKGNVWDRHHQPREGILEPKKVDEEEQVLEKMENLMGIEEDVFLDLKKLIEKCHKRVSERICIQELGEELERILMKKKEVEAKST